MRDTDQKARYRTHKNSERQVHCPYCDATITARGLYQHVWRSGDDAHGGHKEMPETWDEDKDELEEAGTADVTLHVPTKKKYDHQRVLCKFCGEDFKGTHGLSVHLSRTNDSLHPKDATVKTAGLRVPVGPDDRVVLEDDMLDEIDGHNIDPSQFSDASILEPKQDGSDSSGKDETDDTPDGHVPIPDLVELVSYYESDGKMEAAEELRGLIKKYS